MFLVCQFFIDKKYAKIENNYYKDIENLNNELSDHAVNIFIYLSKYSM